MKKLLNLNKMESHWSTVWLYVLFISLVITILFKSLGFFIITIIAALALLIINECYITLIVVAFVIIGVYFIGEAIVISVLNKITSLTSYVAKKLHLYGPSRKSHVKSEKVSHASSVSHKTQVNKSLPLPSTLRAYKTPSFSSIPMRV